MTRTIEIDNIHAIEHVSIPIPEDGGFVVLKGTHGVGKSTAIRTVESLLTGQHSLERRDGTLEGTVSGFGATISVKKQIRRRGEPELAVSALAGRLSLADIVDPHIKDPLSADAYRIKALLQIAGAKPDEALFYDLFGGAKQYSDVIGTVTAPDLIAFAAQVKKNAEIEARESEREAERSQAQAVAYRQQAAGFEGVELRDPAELQADLEDAIRRESQLKAEAKAAQEKIDAAKHGREVLEDAKTAYDGPTVEDATKAVDAAAFLVTDAEGTIERLEEALEAAREKLRSATATHQQASFSLKSAKQHADDMAGWQAAIDAGANVTAPDENQLAGAAEAVAIARRAIEQQALARKAKDAEERAKLEEARAKQHAADGERYRKAAHGTEAVLSEAVGRLNCPLRVKDGRLVLDTDRGEELFADLSDGERYRVAFDIAIPLLPPDGLLTLSQAAFGELSPATKGELNAALKVRRAVCLTAQVDDCPHLGAMAFDDIHVSHGGGAE